jgi:hypothetical protein
MKVRELFSKDIFRPINGVVKADQVDDSTVWQELDEFVVTRELNGHIGRFFGAYKEGLENPKDASIAGKIGVWISGFFGSGKSHFIKILSYVLRNRLHTHEGVSKKAVEFFEEKILDKLMFSDIKKAVDSHTDVILFNIDSKANARAGRDAILSVFMKVLNEMQGFCPEYPHIAHMERYLDSKGKLNTFQDEYKKLTSLEWAEERDAYAFNRDEVVKAFSKALGQSQESAEKWVDNAEGNYTLSVESFCKCVKDYLDKQKDGRRLIFLVDEVGGFIGRDGGLMLNLQTIVENLGTQCGGRAWVVVTAQEDLDKVLGEMPRTAANDFSKIQGRFKTRLSLSSANVDEVIQERLLLKKGDPAVSQWLTDTYREKGDILKNQLSFSKCGMTFRQYGGAEDFAKNYPFAPYQFQLLQKIFEAIRTKGATGMHLAQGERSLLDAFQSAAQAVGNQDVGVLVPLYRFYPSIESFLETAVKRTIDQAKDNPSLKPFDNEILRVLFLIRYVDEMKGNIDNLTTLCTDKIDANRIALKRQIEESLIRLEKETLITRSGDNYFFLTDAERDINREIKQVDLSSNEEGKALGEILFDDILRGVKKYRYPANKRDFDFNRMCDGYPIGNRIDKALTVQVVTPLADVEREALEDGYFLRTSGQDGGQVVIRLDDDPSLARELRQYLQTEKYLRSSVDDTTPEMTKQIHRSLANDNTERRKRLELILSQLLGEATYFANGQRLTIRSGSAQTALEESLEYLVQNTTPKLVYITKYSEDPKRELQAILRANDVGRALLDGLNERALDEIRDFVDLSARSNHQMVLFNLVEKFGGRPYGWPDDETLIVIARLLVLGEIQLVMDAAPIPVDRVYDAITSIQKQRRMSVIRRTKTDSQTLQDCRLLGREIFTEMGPDSEDGLYEFLKSKFQALKTSLTTHKALADTKSYPGLAEITDGLNLANAVLAPNDPATFLTRFLENKAALQDLAYEYSDIDHFYTHQRPLWDKLRRAYDRFQTNRLELVQDEAVGQALDRLRTIRDAASPYKMLSEAEGLIERVEKLNTTIVEKARAEALNRIDLAYRQVLSEVERIGGEDGIKKACIVPLDNLREQIQKQDSVAHIAQMVSLASGAVDAAIGKIDEYLRGKTKDKDKKVEPPKPRKEIRPADLVAKPCLETEDDINKFLDALRKELHASLSRGERIHIR